MEQIQQLNFSSHITPQPIEVVQNETDNKYVYYGQDNLYPNFLLKLYNDSPLHKGISNSKLDYIKGEGLKYRSGNKVDIKPNASDSFEEFTNKVILDFIIFNSFSIEVIYNKLGKAIQWVHLPVSKLRTNRSRNKFWYCNDWYLESKNQISYDRWVAGENKDLKSKVYHYSAYAPSVNNVYSIPTYSGAIKSIETDIAIRDFHINNIENSFSVSSIISFFNGEPNDEVKRNVQSKITNTYTGSTGGKFIINYVPKDGKGAEVQNLSPNDWDKAFEQLKQDTLQDILVAHSATSPMLFGIKTEGQLGGASELETAYEIFKNLYVKGKRNELENALNKLFSDSGIKEMEFKDAGALFNTTMSEATKEKIYTINELRAEAGKEPLLDGNRLLGDVKTSFASNTLESIEDVGNPTESENQKEIITTKKAQPNIELIKHLGLRKEVFHTFKKDLFHAHTLEEAKTAELAFSDDSDIEAYLLKAKTSGKTIEEIKTEIRKDIGINITASDLQVKIAQLISGGLITKSEDGGKISITPTAKGTENVRRVEVRYSYEVRPGLGAPIIDTSRDFCKELLKEDKYYTRTEIQTMSAIYGYDIFTHTGGWYFNPNDQKSVNHCRHKWSSVSVVKK